MSAEWESVIINGNINEIETFINDGFNINSQNNEKDSPLNVALINKREIEVIQLLLKYGADPNIQNYYYFTSLHHAISKKYNLNTIELLLNHGYIINRKSDAMASPILYFVLFNKHPDMIKLLELLFKYGVDPNIQSNHGYSLLNYAIFENNNIETLELLINHGANLNVCDSIGNSLLHTAIDKHREINLIKFLINHKIDVNKQNISGETILHTILYKTILDQDVKMGMTRDIQIQINNKVKDIVEVLLKNGCSTSIHNRNRQTPLDIAKSRNLIDICQLIESYQLRY